MFRVGQFLDEKPHGNQLCGRVNARVSSCFGILVFLVPPHIAARTYLDPIRNYMQETRRGSITFRAENSQTMLSALNKGG